MVAWPAKAGAPPRPRGDDEALRIPWLVALAASTLLPSPLPADTGARIALRWAAPAECPSGAAVGAEVDRLLGPTAARLPAPIAVSAEVARDDRGAWHVHLETPGEGTPRVREIHGASCAAIADATALILALRIDPAAALAAPSAVGSPPEAPRSPPEAPRTPADAVRPPPGAVTPPPEAPRLPRSVIGSPPARSAPTPTSWRAAAWAGLDTASLSRLAATFALLDELDDEKRAVLVLAELEQMTAPEIAESLGVNLHTVYARLRAARRELEQAAQRERARDTWRLT